MPGGWRITQRELELHRTRMIQDKRLASQSPEYIVLLTECCKLYDEQQERIRATRRKAAVPTSQRRKAA